MPSPIKCNTADKKLSLVWCVLSYFTIGVCWSGLVVYLISIVQGVVFNPFDSFLCVEGSWVGSGVIVWSLVVMEIHTTHTGTILVDVAAGVVNEMILRTCVVPCIINKILSTIGILQLQPWTVSEGNNAILEREILERLLPKGENCHWLFYYMINLEFCINWGLGLWWSSV